MATQTTTFTIYLSNDVDFDEVRVDGEELLGFYIEDHPWNEIQYKLSGKDKKFFDLDGNGLLSFDSKLTESNIEARSGKVSFQIKALDTVSDDNDKEVLSLGFSVDEGDDSFLTLDSGEIAADGGEITILSFDAEGLDDSLIETISVSDDRFTITKQGGEWILTYDGNTAPAEGQIELTFGIRTTDHKFFADSVSLEIQYLEEEVINDELEIPDTGINGAGQDGYIHGGTVWADSLIANATLDVGEVSSITDEYGNFSLPGSPTGFLYLEGGTDVATLLAFEGRMSAPQGSTVISPVTTLIVAVMQERGDAPDDPAAAEALVKAAFGLDPAVDLTQYDPIAVLANPEATGAEKLAASNVFAVGSTVLNATTITGQLLANSGAAVNPSFHQAEAAVYEALALEIIAGGGVIDLSNPTTIEGIVDSAAALLGFTPTEQAAVDTADTATVISESNALIDAATPDTEAEAEAASGTDILEETTQVSATAQGEVAAAAADGDIDATDLDDYSGTGLETNVGDTPIGDVSPSSILGTAGDDTPPGFIGMAGLDDILLGLEGNDTLVGLTGNDTLDGGDGSDTVDYLDSLYGMNISLASGLALDRGDLNDPDDDGLLEADTLISIENVTGSNFDDVIVGDDNVNILRGEDGNDNIRGEGGIDTIDGGPGHDQVNYIFYAGLFDGAYQPANTLDVTIDTDTRTISTTLNGTEGGAVETALNTESIIGGAGPDSYTVIGSDWAQIVETPGGNTITGGPSSDTITYLDLGDGVPLVVDLEAGTATGLLSEILGTGSDTISGVENISVFNVGGLGNWVGATLLGDSNNNILSGGTQDDTLQGRDGDDTLNGNDGDDFLAGGWGIDTMDGGAGMDTVGYVYRNNDAAGEFDYNPARSISAIIDSNAHQITVAFDDGGIDEGAAQEVSTNVEALVGTIFSDSITITGGGEARVSDIINGNTITGGGGVDTVVYLDVGVGDPMVIDLGDSAEVDGIETGTYTGDGTGAFSSSTATDTNAEAGLSHPAGTPTANVAGNVLTFNDGGGDTELVRLLPDGSKPLVGTWIIDDGGNLITLTFLDDSHYVMSQEGPSDEDGHAGMERGTYSWDSGTGAFTATAEVDTNGQWGLSHPRGELTVTVVGDALTFTENVPGETPEPIQADRLLPDGNQLVGTWTVNDWTDPASDLAVVTFLADGRYTMLQDGPDPTGFASGSFGSFFGNVDTLVGIENISISNVGGGGWQAVDIKGSHGNNALTGGNQDDKLMGRGGEDTLDGGEGRDTAIYVNDPAGVTVNLETGTATDGWGHTDTLLNIESVEGSLYDDSLTGDAGDNYLAGGAGVDTIDGGDGEDTVSFINDPLGPVTPGLTITISGTTITSDGGTPGDNSDDETAINVERVLGSLAQDTITGDAGDNTIGEFMGGNTIDGGAGVDSVQYLDGGIGALTIDLTAETATGSGWGSDSLVDIENVTIINVGPFGPGWAGATLIGNDENNELTGGVMDDIIQGGAGNDILTGSDGNDSFVYIEGDDVIADFDPSTGEEHIDLRSATVPVYNFTDLTLSAIADVNGDGIGETLVEMAGTADTIVLLGIDDPGLLGVQHFKFTGQTLVGTPGDDVLPLLQGADGDDLIVADSGNDQVDGGGGSNTIDYSDDVLDQFLGNPSEGVRVNLLPIGWTVGDIFLNSNEAQDPDGGLDSLANIHNVIGTDNPDFIIGNVFDGNTVIDGRGGDDELVAGGGTLTGGGGADTFTFANGHDIITDFLFGGESDKIDLSRIPVFEPVDLLPLVSDGPDGVVIDLSTVQYNDGTFVNGSIILAGLTLADLDPGGGDFILAEGFYIGGDENDIVTDDTLVGYDKGDDTLDGRGGTDTADYSGTGHAMAVNLGTGQAQDNNGTANDNTDDGALQTDTLVSIENIIGTAFGDNLVGDDFANTIYGGDGDDFIGGGMGIDALDGGDGWDNLNLGLFNHGPLLGQAGLDIDIDGTTITSTQAAIVGTWTVGTPGADDASAAIHFFANGTYMMLEDGDDLDGTGMDGIERGQYNWDQDSGAFSLANGGAPYTDTNGEWGLSHPVGDVNVTVVGDVMTVAITGDPDVILNRLQADTSAIVGSWVIPNTSPSADPAGGDLAVVTFYDNGTYVMAEDAPVGGGGMPGMERGTYTWDAGTGVLSATTLEDTNGEWGLSHLPGGQTASIENGALILDIPGDDQVTLFRLEQETEVAYNFEGITASLGRDTITATDDGSDTRVTDVMGGNSISLGDGGNDSVTYLDLGFGALTVNLETGNATGSWFGGDFLSGVEHVSIFSVVAPGLPPLQGATLIGNGGNNELSGGIMDDIIQGGAGNDTLTGGDGNDSFVYIEGDDVIADFDPGTGEERIDLRSATVPVYNFSDLTLSAIADVNGDGIGETRVEMAGTADTIVLLGVDDPGVLGPQHFMFIGQTLVGTPGDDSLPLLQGGDGDDLVVADSGNDQVDGGGGSNTIDYSDDVLDQFLGNPFEGVRVNLLPIGWTVGGVFLNSNEALDPDGWLDSLANIQNVIGTDNNDFIIGNIFDGNTVIDGRGGDDELVAGGGTLTGGGGADTFVYFAGDDTITDFEIDPVTAIDKIDFSQSNLPIFGLGDLFPPVSGNVDGNAVFDFSQLQLSDGSYASGSITLVGHDIFNLQTQAPFFIYNTGVRIEGDGPDGTTPTVDNLVGYESGNDSLNGLEDNDTLNGLGGNDILTGGNGSDLFQFNVDDGDDVITDFVIGTDDVQLLDSLTVTSYNDTVDADLDGDTDDTIVTLSDASTITLLDAIVTNDGDLLI